MFKYLGEKIVLIEETPYKNYKAKDFAMYFIERYGGIDGNHHKTWVLDQVSRCLKGTKVIIKRASWDNGQIEQIEWREWRIQTDKPSKKYLKWVKDMCKDGEYEYDEGIAP